MVCLPFCESSPFNAFRLGRWKTYLKLLVILNVAWIGYLVTKRYSPDSVNLTGVGRRSSFRWLLKNTKTTELPESQQMVQLADKHPVDGVRCDRFFQGEEVMISKSKSNMFMAQRARDISAFSHLSSSGNCADYHIKRGYFMKNGSPEEARFPLAYSILTYKEFHQVERLLRAIYRPQNFYCIHYDAKSDSEFKNSLNILADCFDNVFIASQIISVKWGKFSVLQADLICMNDLLKVPNWKYFINLTGQEFPLKTNWQIVKILQAYRGANDIKATKRRRNRGRTKKFEPAPHNISIYKGPVHVILSRPFVDFMFTDQKAKEFLEWTKLTIIPDETFFVTLQHNPSLGGPGAFNGTSQELEDKNSMARYKLWRPINCGGKRVRQICIFNEKDLPGLKNAPQLFANKFHFDYGELAYECLEELHWNRTRDEYLQGSTFNTTFYEQLSLVKYSVNKLPPVEEVTNNLMEESLIF